MARYEITGPDGSRYEVTAPDGASEQEVMSFFQAQAGGGSKVAPKQEQGWLDWGKELVQGRHDPRFKDLQTVYAQEPLFGATQQAADRAATLGASDEQLADIYKKQLGDRFLNMEKDANGYYVVTFKGDDGKPRQGYVNQPGLDMADVTRGVRGALPYMLTGGAAGLAGRGLGLVANSALQGGTAAATSMAGDLAQIPMGSEQGIEGGKAVVGGVLGAAGPPVARGIANAREVIANRFGGVPDPLQPFHRNAVQRVGSALDADNLDNLAYQQQAANLGREGMIADMGPTAQMATARIARNPGEGRGIVTGALDRRQAGAQQRIDADVTGALGPRRNMPEYVRQQRENYSRLAQPHYQQLDAADIPLTPQLEDILRRSEAMGATAKAQQWMAQEGLPIQRRDGTVSGRFLQYVKEAVDDVAGTAVRSGERNAARRSSTVARELRDTVDNILAPGRPEQSPWFQGRAIYGQGAEGADAAELGSKVFTQKRDPNQVADELGDLSLYGQDLYRMGARNDLRQIAGRAATAYGPNADTALRRSLSNDFNRQNVEQITQSRPAAERLARRIAAETAFAETNDAAQRNSITSTMQAAEELVPTPRGSNVFENEGKKGVSGKAYELALRLADWLAGGRIDARTNTITRDMARLLTAQGQTRDEIAEAFFRLRQRRGVNRDRAAALERAINAARIASQGPAAAYASGE